MRCLHILVHGRVQGVGYRAFVERQAHRHGLDGWVRNRRDGTVEAVLAGPADRVEAMLAACREGPPSAAVHRIDSAEASAEQMALNPQGRGFPILASL